MSGLMPNIATSCRMTWRKRGRRGRRRGRRRTRRRGVGG